MSIRQALIAVVALVMMARPTIAANANLTLECGAAKSTPPDNDSDPIYKTKIAVNRRGHIRRALCCQRRSLYSQ